MTKRQFVLALLAIGLLSLPLSHSMVSAKKKAKKKGPAPKVAICHFPDDSTVGHVIEVSGNAVDAHKSKHGDCTPFVPLEGDACRCPTCTELCRIERAQHQTTCEETCGTDTTCLNACIARINAEAQACVRRCQADGTAGG